MKPFILFIIACLCGCERHHEAIKKNLPAVSEAQLAETFGPSNFQDLTNAIANAATKADIIPLLCANEYQRQIEILASMSLSELNRRLDTVRRGTSRSGYTEAQLLTAIHIKEQRLADKSVNK